jgi:hypothetical protein
LAQDASGGRGSPWRHQWRSAELGTHEVKRRQGFYSQARCGEGCSRASTRCRVAVWARAGGDVREDGDMRMGGDPMA